MKKRSLIFCGLFFVFALTTSLDMPSPPPSAPMGAYLNGVFPETSPNSNWVFEDPFPDFTFKNPLRIIPFPGTEDHLLLCKSGEIWRLSFAEKTRELVLDMRAITLDESEAGAVGFALHPAFGEADEPEKQSLFVFYRSKPQPNVFDHRGYNRLSKFSWDVQTAQFDLGTEEILIQQYDRNAYHNGGGMFFGNDGFLYLSLGDEGLLDGHPVEVPVTTQRLDNGLFSGVLRIDVDNDPTRSHPIRRQPNSPADPPAGWEGSYTQGYSIPNDNPWLDPTGNLLEEFFAIGIRSPYSMCYDQQEDRIWLADVGSDKREEINIVEKGDNLQWPFKEGTLSSTDFDRPTNLIGEEKEPYWEYGRSEGTCVIGGGVYYGDKFPELKNKYLYSDWVSNKVLAIPTPTSFENIVPEVLIDNVEATDVEVPEQPGFTGIFPMENGEVMVTIMTHQQLNAGKIFRLVGKVDVPQALGKLSELGVFTDLENLTTAPGLLPYAVNAPLWSDRAVKKRWMALPNDGLFDSPAEQVVFSKNSEWVFPPGTVFVKHFELPLTTEPDGEMARLETRFFIIDKNGDGYGLTYQWNDEGTDAYLLEGAASKEFAITENGAPLFTQTWDFPSPSQCLSCHTDNAKYVLGLKTHQLNGELEYPELGRSMNQLDYLSEYGIFNQEIENAETYPRAAFIEDTDADLDLRVRSYLDANCSSCHRPGGLKNVSLDFRFIVPLSLQNMVNAIPQSHASDHSRLLVEPGSHATSEVWVRDASLSENRMPPIGRNLLDEPYIDALAEWIDGLPSDAGTIQKLLVYPNPVSNWLVIRINDGWSGPFQVNIYSASGQMVYREQSQSISVQTDLSHLESGMYLVEVSDGKNREVARFVKL